MLSKRFLRTNAYLALAGFVVAAIVGGIASANIVEERLLGPTVVSPSAAFLTVVSTLAATAFLSATITLWFIQDSIVPLRLPEEEAEEEEEQEEA